MSDRPKLNWLVPAGVALALTAAGAATYALMSPGTPKPTPSPAAPVVSPSPSDPKLLALQFNFCLAQDRAFKIEEPLIAGPISTDEAVSRLRELEATAREQTKAFRTAGYDDFADMLQAWADGFAEAQTSVEREVDPLKAIRAPIKALRPLLNAIDCEGDA